MTEGVLDLQQQAQRLVDEEGLGDTAQELLEAMADEQRLDDRYKALERVYQRALNDVRDGKGASRHGSRAPFEEQPMLQVRGAFGPGFTLGQAMKKLLEVRGLTPKEAVRELLHVINYVGGEIVALEAEERSS